jgi:hypothetical protein
MGAGAWRHRDLVGYTSVGAGTSLLPVRLNCPPSAELTIAKMLVEIYRSLCEPMTELLP